MPRFTKEILNAMLERIIDEYFAEDNQESLGEIMDYVKGLYSDEIDTLDD